MVIEFQIVVLHSDFSDLSKYHFLYQSEIQIVRGWQKLVRFSIKKTFSGETSTSYIHIKYELITLNILSQDHVKILEWTFAFLHFCMLLNQSFFSEHGLETLIICLPL